MLKHQGDSDLKVSLLWDLRATCLLLISLFIIGFPFPETASAQVMGISYTLTPTIEAINFDDDAALRSAALYGGKLGFGFGEFIELSGVYLFGGDMRTELADLSGFDNATTVLLRQLPSRSTDFYRYGGEFKLNIGRGAVFPFVTLGSGVIRIDPHELNDSKAIYLGGSLGLQYSYRDRYTLVLQASDLSYRYNPAASLMSESDITSLGLTPADFELVKVNNFGASLGVQFYLGGAPAGQLTDVDRALQDQLSGGWRGIGLRLEPAAGRINFNDALGFRQDQDIVGLSAGIDLGPYAGLRGFYWRGTEEGSWAKFDDLQAYGGELKLAFSRVGDALTPYITVGGGYMDVRSGYLGNGVVDPEDRPFAFGGLGLILPVGDQLNIDARLRSVLMSTTGVDNLSDPSCVESSTMFTVGLSFGLGGRPNQIQGVFGHELAASKASQQQFASALTTLDSNVARLESRMDSLATVSGKPGVPQDSTAVLGMAPGVDASGETHPVSEDTPAQEREGRWMTVPVPEEGELYIRFGKPGGVSIETIEGDPLLYYIDPNTGALVPVSPTPQAPLTSTEPAVITPPSGVSALGLTPSQVEEIVRGVLLEERALPEEELPAADEAARLERLENAFESRMTAIETALIELRTMAAPQQLAEGRPSGGPVVVEAPSPSQTPTAIVDPQSRTVKLTRTPSTRFSGLAPVIGYNTDEPKQFLVGLRADFLHRARPFRLTPELVMGFGDDEVTTNVNLNALYDSGLVLLEQWYPYGGIGLGLLNRDELELVLNLVVGSDVRVGESILFVEYVNQDFFDNNRILFGYRFTF